MPVFIDHLTKTSEQACKFLLDHFHGRILISSISKNKPKEKSWEEYWRDERYKIFHALYYPVVTAHHLNDCMETWIFSSLHGKPKMIPYNNKNVIRPFLATSKQEIVKWACNKKVEFIEDDTNKNTAFPRNRIRHNIIPEALKVNPGLSTVIRKKLLINYK